LSASAFQILVVTVSRKAWLPMVGSLKSGTTYTHGTAQLFDHCRDFPNYVSSAE